MNTEAKIFFDLGRRDLLYTAGLIGSIIFRQPRDFLKDSRWFAKNSETSQVLGTENIPAVRPLVIACNHPRAYELLAGQARITNILGDVHWMVAENFASSDHPEPTRSQRFSTWLVRRLHDNYDFIPVPINYNDPGTKILERGLALRQARTFLLDQHGSRIVGIFPEGDFEDDGKLLPFHNGVGQLGKMLAPHITMLPTGIYRGDAGVLTVEFGHPLAVKRGEDPQRITDRLRQEINSVLRKG